MRRKIKLTHTIKFLLQAGILLCVLNSCVSAPSAKDVARNRDFQDNTFSLQMLTTKYGKQTTETVVLFSVEPGYNATVAASLKSKTDLEGAIRYTEIMAGQYQGDLRTRCYLNISLFYYFLGDREKLNEYYNEANRLDFSDETKRTFKKMTVIYPDY